MPKIRNYEIGDEPVPGYRLTAFLGSGGFGDVWKATGPGGTEVAIKINNLAMRGALKEFRSLKLVKKIRYPNLVPILAIWLKNEQGELLAESEFEQVDADSVSSGLTGTMSTETIEYTPQPEPAELIVAMGLGQKSLVDRLDECHRAGLHGIPLDELLKYFQDAARAIDFLNSPRHELDSELKAIQHCDIKPPNILIVGDAAQVCDFGLAREVADLRHTSLALSPVYAAPEMIESNSPSPSTDQYSLAVSYLELRTGELPFPPDTTAHMVIQAHLNGTLDLSKLSPAEQAVIKRATARKPADRFATSSEMVAALREACYPTPVVSSRMSWPWRIAAGAAILLVSAALALAVKMGASGPTALKLPAGFVAAPEAITRTVHDRLCPNRILCRLHGANVPFLLIDSRRTAPFYIMENKVTNELFRRFARENPSLVAASKWEEGPCTEKNDLGIEERKQLPVFRVTCVEAALLARWLDGQLPTAEQWDAASGRYPDTADGEKPAAAGPFRLPWDANKPKNEQVAVDRGSEGPLPVGTATHDISAPFGCRDMAGNGSEWTRSPRDATEKFSPDKPDELLSMILRGRSYLQPEPLRYKDLDDRALDEARRCTESDCDIGFRVVVTFDDLP